MQRIHFCTGTSFVTGDRIASSLLNYAKVLGQTQEFDVVEIPTLREDGSEGRTTLVVSPVSQISSESVVSQAPDVVDDTLVDRLDTRAAYLLAPHPPVVELDVRLSQHSEYLDV